MPTISEITNYIKDKVIDGYMLNDLRRMIGLSIIPNQSGNCNFPIVLYIFSCMEFLGTLVSENPIPNGRGATQARIWAYIELTFNENAQAFQEHRDTFVQIFRHGLVHEFFAKNSGISRNNENLFWRSESGKLILDADKFYEVFCTSCERLKTQISESQELSGRIFERYLQLQQENKERWPTTSPSTTTITSMATLPRQFTPDQSTTTPSFTSEEDS